MVLLRTRGLIWASFSFPNCGQRGNPPTQARASSLFFRVSGRDLPYVSFPPSSERLVLFFACAPKGSLFSFPSLKLLLLPRPLARDRLPNGSSGRSFLFFPFSERALKLKKASLFLPTLLPLPKRRADSIIFPLFPHRRDRDLFSLLHGVNVFFFLPTLFADTAEQEFFLRIFWCLRFVFFPCGHHRLPSFRPFF